jgi:hypothetical protein
MADEKRDAPGGGRRKPPTIDLKATEIASGPVNPTEPADIVKESTSAEAPAEAAAAPESIKAPEPAPQPAAARPESVAPASEKIVPPPGGAAGGMDWRLAAASAAGAGAMLAVLLVILATGVLAPRDDGPRIGQLESQVRTLASRPQPAPDALADLTARLNAAEQALQRLAGLETRLGRAEQGIGRVAEIDARLAKAEKDAGRVGDLEQRLARGDGAGPRPAGDPALADRVAALEAALRPLADLGPRLEATTAAAREARSRADAAFEAAQRTPPAPAVANSEFEALAARVVALEQGARAAQERIAATAGADKAGRLAFVAVSLRAAVERGEPFAQELAAARPLADPKLIGALEPFAASGVPRNAALSRELSQLSGAMLNAAGAPPREGGFIDRLQANAERLVRIRPINEAPGDDAATVITRADVKAANGNIAGALAEVKSLPAAVTAPAQGWIRKAEAQIAALAAARSLADGAIGALAKP